MYKIIYNGKQSRSADARGEFFSYEYARQAVKRILRQKQMPTVLQGSGYEIRKVA